MREGASITASIAYIGEIGGDEVVSKGEAISDFLWGQHSVVPVARHRAEPCSRFRSAGEDPYGVGRDLRVDGVAPALMACFLVDGGG